MTPIDHPSLGGRPRLLIALLAQSADAAAPDMLRRIPPELREGFDLQVLLIEDAADDAAFQQTEVARRIDQLPYPLEVLSSKVGHGYGGCQKLGLQYAVEHRFDCVVVLDSSGESDPTQIEAVIAPILEGRADGTSMARKPGTRERLATMLYSRILRLPLDSVHRGTRAYRVAALEKIPFELDTDERHIDTELLIQFRFAGLRFVDVAPPAGTPTAATTPSLHHLMNGLRAVTRARMQKMNLFYERRFDCDPTEQENARYHLKLDFDSSHRRALAHIPHGSRVLDLGCAGGHFANVLERDHGCTVTAFDRGPLAPGVQVTEFHQRDLDEGPPDVDYASFDVIIMLDVIEHLREPEEFVRQLYAATSSTPSLKLVFTTANVGFILTRVGLLLGQFNYGKRGILDLTHTRLFTLSTFRRLFQQDGFRIVHEEGVPAPFELATTNRLLSSTLVAISRALLRPLPRVFSYQLLLVMQPRASLELLLARASRRSKDREAAIRAQA